MWLALIVICQGVIIASLGLTWVGLGFMLFGCVAFVIEYWERRNAVARR